MTNIAFIPVRGGSKSIPLKNIKDLLGKPLVYWTAVAANNAKCIDKVIIATDSDEIKTVIKSFGLEKVEIYDRNPQNAQDSSSTESVMLEYVENSDLNDDDYFFLIQATSPLLKANHIDEMFEKLKSGNADSALSCVLTKRFFWGVDDSAGAEPVNYDYKNRPRRQDYDGMMMENGACYINSVKNIKQDKNRLSGKISIYEMPEYTSIEIDEPSDWVIMEELMRVHND